MKELTEVLSVRRKILIVDDQEINRDLLSMILEDDFDILCAENGAAAMDLIHAHPGVISSVLLDLMMPVMNGYQVIEALKKDPATAHIPIIVLTSEANAELETLRMGAASFIPKPFHETEVIRARVARIVELAESRKTILATEKDPLTGLYQENYFFLYAEQLLRYHPDWKLDALVLNIDRFSLLNEMYGRDFCDTVLTNLGSLLRSSPLLSDGIFGRIQADLFYLLVPVQKDYTPLLEELQEKLSALRDRVRVRLRLGIYCLEEEQEALSPDTLLSRAFARAKAACAQYRGQYHRPVNRYDENIHRQEILQEKLVNDLPRALRNREFQVWLQPQYNITGETPMLTGAEALIRWNHPELGMVSPGVFISLFENVGLIHAVDSYVWQEAVELLERWRKKYGTSFTVSVNLSRVDLHEPGLKKNLLSLLEEHHLTPADLHLEITESAYTEDAEMIPEIVRRLRGLGFAVEMDDFGSGYSSLNMLSELPLDVLKMDMRFIRDLKDRTSRAFRMVEIIADIARTLEVPLLAEGIETAEQAELLRQVGCSFAQGYYYSRPLPVAEFEKLLERGEHQETVIG